MKVAMYISPKEGIFEKFFNQSNIDFQIENATLGTQSSFPPKRAMGSNGCLNDDQQSEA